MTETQATSGAGTSANPAGKDSADGDAKATGRAVVGRAAVGAPADAPSSPKFTRAPGMKPPPDEAPAADGKEPAKPASGAAKGAATPAAGKSATAPAKTTPGKATPGKATPPPAKGGGQGGTGGGVSAFGGLGDRTERIPAGAGRTTTGTTSGGKTGTTSGAARNAGAAAVGAARVSDAVKAARSAVSSAAARGPRRARLNVKRIDPWSVMKFSFAVSLVLFIVLVVATSVLYLALDAMGVFKSVNESLTELVNASGGDSSGGFRITARGVIGTSALIGLVNVVLFTALATLSAFIYNVCADLVGGVELTLAERD